MNKYRHPALKQFTEQQKRFAPTERKVEQLNRAERVLAELEAKSTYPYQYLCFRITEYRPDVYPDLVISGEDAFHDLRQFIEDVSDSANISMQEAGEPVLTVEELSKQFNISTKTVNRWRDRGLVSRRFVIDGRKRLGFLRSSVDHFVNTHSEAVDRGTRFSQLSEEERDEIILRARRLARVGGSTLAEIARRIARKLNRSPETVRYTIKRHDVENPGTAVFGPTRGVLDEKTRESIFSSYRHGISIDDLADRFHRTRSTVYRIINEIRAEKVLDQPAAYMYHPSFDQAGAEHEILGPEPAASTDQRTVRPPAGLPQYLLSLYEYPLFSKEQEQYLFRKMNYLIHRATKMRKQVKPHRAKASLLDQIERLENEALDIKRRIIRANLRLVVSIAKRHVGSAGNLFELISDGNLSLMRAVEKFDFGRGFKFSTYASWAIMKNFARSIPAESTHRDRFLTGQDMTFEMTADANNLQQEKEDHKEQVHTAIERILGRLDERERQVVEYRYGLSGDAAPETLEEVGNRFGVTKERIRQIEARAIGKLRQIAAEEHVDISILG